MSAASLLPPLYRSNNDGAIRFRSIVWLNVLYPPSPVVALHREVSGFQRDDAECFAFFVAQFSRFRDATCRLDS